MVLLNEAMNSAVLDSACSSTVAGSAWTNCDLDSLELSARNKVKHSSSDTVFRFGGGIVLESQEKVTFPCMTAGVECDIETDIVHSDILLHVSKTAIEKAKVKLDLENDCASIFGTAVQLQCTCAAFRHYCVPIDQSSSVGVHETAEALLYSHVEDDKTKVIEKLHKQFAHPSAKSLMKDAGGYTADHLKCVDVL